MIVALTWRSMYLKEQLESYGHKIVEVGKYRGAIDALVYSGTSVSDLKLLNSNFPNGCGVLVIDCTNRSAEFVNSCLIRRTFSPLF